MWEEEEREGGRRGREGGRRGREGGREGERRDDKLAFR